jgi:protein-disulfide isomerase
MRRRPPIIPLTLLAAMSLGASCSGAQGDTSHGNGNGHEGPAPGPRVESLEEVDISELSRVEQRVWVELINDLLSPCGEPITVGRCVSENRSCRRCVPAARYLVRLITEGFERTQVEELYAMRYGRDTALEIDTDGAPSRGSPMAQVTIVEFSDFECPYCGRAHPVVQQVLREFDGRVRVVFKHFPLSGHPRALPAARAAIAAGNQGKFWEMHDMLFEHQSSLEDEDLDGYAEELHLDMERFHADIESAATQQIIEHDRDQGLHLPVTSTPSFFVNGRRFSPLHGEGGERSLPGHAPAALPDYIREELDQ